MKFLKDIANNRILFGGTRQFLLLDNSFEYIVNGLVVWWQFEEGTGTLVNDNSGHGNTGTLTNSPSWVAGKIGSFGIRTQTTNDLITVSAISMSGSWTISAWTFFPQPAAAGVNSLTRDGAGLGSGNIHVVVIGGALGVYISSDGIGFHSSGYDVSGFSGWHVITAVGTGGTTTFYVDGVNVGSANAQATDIIDTVGNNIQNSNQPWGTFDDFRIYNRALSLMEIQNIANLRG